MRRMLLVWCCVCVCLVACGPPKTVVTEPGQRAWYALQISTWVGKIQRFVADAESTGALPRNDARTIMAWTVATEETLQQFPEGWASTIKTGWYAAKRTLPATWLARPEVALAIASLEAILEILTPPPPAAARPRVRQLEAIP